MPEFLTQPIIDQLRFELHLFLFQCIWEAVLETEVSTIVSDPLWFRLGC